MGHSFLRGRLNITPYSGVGYRYWVRGITEEHLTSQGETVQGIRSEYTWGFATLGSDNAIEFSNRWTGAFDIAVLFPLDGKMKLYLSHVFDCENKSYNLDLKPGFRIRAPVSFNLSEKVALCFTTRYVFWRIAKGKSYPSNTDAKGTIHHSTLEAGVVYIF